MEDEEDEEVEHEEGEDEDVVTRNENWFHHTMEKVEMGDKLNEFKMV